MFNPPFYKLRYCWLFIFGQRIGIRAVWLFNNQGSMASTCNSYDNGSLGKPPRLSRDNFSTWKNWMQVFLNGVDYSLLDIIKDGPYIPRIVIPASPATKSAPCAKKGFRDKEKSQ